MQKSSETLEAIRLYVAGGGWGRTDLCPIIYHLHDIGFQCFIQRCKIGIFFWTSTNQEHKKKIGLEKITQWGQILYKSHIGFTKLTGSPHGFTKIEFRIFQAITMNLSAFL